MKYSSLAHLFEKGSLIQRLNIKSTYSRKTNDKAKPNSEIEKTKNLFCQE